MLLSDVVKKDNDGNELPNTWVTEQQFYAGLGAVQAMPGPLFNFSAYLGCIMAIKVREMDACASVSTRTEGIPPRRRNYCVGERLVYVHMFVCVCLCVCVCGAANCPAFRSWPACKCLRPSLV